MLLAGVMILECFTPEGSLHSKSEGCLAQLSVRPRMSLIPLGTKASGSLWKLGIKSSCKSQRQHLLPQCALPRGASSVLLQLHGCLLFVPRYPPQMAAPCQQELLLLTVLIPSGTDTSGWLQELEVLC